MLFPQTHWVAQNLAFRWGHLVLMSQQVTSAHLESWLLPQVSTSDICVSQLRKLRPRELSPVQGSPWVMRGLRFLPGSTHRLI